jgi:hypothetical protein
LLEVRVILAEGEWLRPRSERRYEETTRRGERRMPMAANPPTGMLRITPCLLYEDVAGALAVWYFATHVWDVAPEEMKPPA